MKTLSQLQAECQALGIRVASTGRSSKEPYISALQRFYWERENPGKAMPTQVLPMLLEDWNSLASSQTAELENDHYAWIVQQKYDGVRALLHVTKDGIRITGRNLSEVHYRLTEFQENLSHLCSGLSNLVGSIFDGELVCPRTQIDTGSTVTTSALQGCVAILAAGSDKAETIQRNNGAFIRMHLFDVLSYCGKDVTELPLHERLQVLERGVRLIENDHFEIVPSYSVNKSLIHKSIVKNSGEGTVWKKADSFYEPGKRVNNWIKRKRDTEVEAFVSGFKLGNPEGSNSNLIGAIEFSVQEFGEIRPVAWVSGWSNEERDSMTSVDSTGTPVLKSSYFGRRAIVQGQDESGKSKRIRHARLKQWIHS